MKIKHAFFLISAFTILGCNNCEKLYLTPSQKEWVNHFKPMQKLFYRSFKGEIDTLEIIATNNYFTPCNKFELSEYQFEIFVVRYKIKSKGIYNNNESFLSVTTEKLQKNNPYIYFGNLGPYRNDLENKNQTPIDTILNGVKCQSVFYYAQGLNTEEYGEVEYFINFFCNKQFGLIAYTTYDDKIFIREN